MNRNEFSQNILKVRYVIGIAIWQWFFIMCILIIITYNYYDALNLFADYKKVSNSKDIEQYFNNKTRIITFETELIKTDFATYDKNTGEINKIYYLAKLDDCYIPVGIWATSKKAITSPYVVYGMMLRKGQEPPQLINSLNKFALNNQLSMPIIAHEITIISIFEQRIVVTFYLLLIVIFIIVAIYKIRKYWHVYFR